MNESQEGLRIMVVAADPLSTKMDLLEEECETIKAALGANQQSVVINPVRVSSAQEFQKQVQSHQPEVLHFTGHGSPTGRVSLENSRGRIQRKSGKSIAQLLNQTNVRPECIVLNNCSIGRQRQDLLSACDNFVGMTVPEGFDFALHCASSFYRRLTGARDYGSACEQVRADLDDTEMRNLVRIEFRHEIKRGEEPHESISSEDADETGRLENFDMAHGKEFDSMRAPRATTKISDENEPRKFGVWFGTNRRPLDPTHPENGFGPQRDDRAHFGVCEVAIPKFHKIGSVGSPWWSRWPIWESDRLRLVSIAPFEVSQFYIALQTALASVPMGERVILLFVHGYNVSFEEAAVRAAQLGADLAIPGITAFYSWPSKGRVKDYAADVASVEASEDYMREFLERLASTSGASKIHVVAHSMGNRGLIRAFNVLFSKITRDAKIRFSQIFLAAPDIDCALFKQLAVAYTQLSERTTLYVSSKDKALSGSSFLHDYPRAGYKPPVTIVDDVDTVEVSSIDPSFLGHSYIAAARDVLHDMHALMLANTPPDARMGVASMIDSTTGRKYWKLRA